MLPIDPGDGPGSVTPAQPLRDTAQPLRDIVPFQAMAHGGTIIRPGAVAWGGMRDARDEGYSSCEVIERALAAVTRNPAALPGLLGELAACRLWVPLPVRQRPFTDGAAVRLPLVSYQGGDYVPCFTSVQRLNAWAAAAETAVRAGDPADRNRPWQRPGEPPVIPHVVLAAIGLARRLPSGLGLALNPDSHPGLPLHPECVPYLARLSAPAVVEASGGLPHRGLALQHLVSETGVRFLIGQPPAEPSGLLAAARARLGKVPEVRQAARAWLSVPRQGEGLVIALILDDPASAPARAAGAGAVEQAVAEIPLRVPFPVDVTFPGEPSPVPYPARHAREAPVTADPIAGWISRNVRPFYTRD
jgi:SseB protein N-terminal domain/SseB protein C-terminal domain